MIEKVWEGVHEEGVLKKTIISDSNTMQLNHSPVCPDRSTVDPLTNFFSGVYLGNLICSKRTPRYA